MTPDDLRYLRMLAAHKQPQNVDLLAAHGQEPALSPPVSAITGAPEPTFEDKARFLSKLNEFAKLQGDRFIGEPLQAMNRIGGFMTGESNPYVVDEINDPRTVAIKQAKDTLEALGLYSGPGILTGKASANVLRTFGGELAERAPSKQSGRWFTGMEGKPRFEIDDSAMKVHSRDSFESWGTREDMKRGNSVGEMLPNVIYEHKELFDQYPELKEVYVTMRPDSSGGSFDEKNMVATIGYDTKTGEIDKDTLIHELQHWIQQKEGFARGGSPEQELALIQKQARQARREADMVKNQLYKKYGKLEGDAREEVLRLEQIARDLEQKESIGLWSGGMDNYQRLAGEIEARDAANRRTWPMDLRQTMPPDLRKDAIIRYGKP